MSLAERDVVLRELMDDPDCDPEQLRATLRRFDTINRLGIYKRAESHFNNSEFAAQGLPTPGELKLLEPFRAELPGQRLCQPPEPGLARDIAVIARDRHEACDR